MTTYNTGNPLGSVDVRDLYDNAQNMDNFSNGHLGAYEDRLGVSRKSWAGMEADFAAFLLASGYEFIGDYDTDGPLLIERPNQVFTKDGEYWRSGPELVLPYTTVNNWVTDAPKFVSAGDAVLRSDLASAVAGKGAELVYYKGRTVHERLSDIVSVLDFGAVGDGVANDTPAFQAAFASLVGKGGTVIAPAGKNYLIDTSFTVPVNCTLQGAYSRVGSPGNNTSAPYGNMGSLILNSAASISVASSSGVDGVFIRRKGMTFPTVEPSAFAGTAIIGVGDDVFVQNSMIIGFAKAFYSTGTQRAQISGLLFDCLNGVHIDNSLDVPRLRDCHGWPFATIEAAAAGTAGASIIRSGNAFWLSGEADWAAIHGCFSYGYSVGFLLDDVNLVSLSQCGADNIPTNTGSVGFKIINGCTDTTMVACQAAAQTYGVYINTVVVANLHTKIAACDFFGNSGSGVLIDGGDLTITNTSMRNAPNGIAVNNANSDVIVDSCRFNQIGDSCVNQFVANPNVFIRGCMFGDLASGVSPSRYNGSIPSLPATSTLSLSPNIDIYRVAAGVTVNSIAGGYPGRRIVLKFDASVSVTNGAGVSGPSNAGIRLNGSSTFAAVSGSTIELFFDGGYWYEIGRCA